MELKFIVGYDFQSFLEYYKTLDTLHNYYKTLNQRDVIRKDLGPDEYEIIRQNPSHLIVWKANDEIVGHAIWHETGTDEDRNDNPRDESERILLREIFRGKNNQIVELHELWLRPVHRGKRYGQQFFEYFEQFIREQGFLGIIYYSENPSAINICRKRGYKEVTGQLHSFILKFEP